MDTGAKNTGARTYLTHVCCPSQKVHHMQDERHQSNPSGKLEDSTHLFCVHVADLAAVLLLSSIETILQTSPSTDGLGLWFGLPSEGSWFHVE